MTLVELQVALVVGTIIAAAALTALLSVRRVVEGMLRQAEGERVGGDAIAVLEALGQHLRYPKVLGDTALHGELRIGVGVVCRVTPTTVALTPAFAPLLAAVPPGSTPPLTVLAETPIVGDRLEAYASDSSADGGWRSHVVSGVTLVAASEACGTDGVLVGTAELTRAALRLALDPMPRSLAVGAPAELYREIRLVLYQAGTPGWSIGMRSCVGTRCGAAQPVVGPVRSPAARGLWFRMDPGSSLVQAEVRVAGIDHPFEGSLRASGFSP